MGKTPKLLKIPKPSKVPLVVKITRDIHERILRLMTTPFKRSKTSVVEECLEAWLPKMEKKASVAAAAVSAMDEGDQSFAADKPKTTIKRYPQNRANTAFQID